MPNLWTTPPDLLEVLRFCNNKLAKMVQLAYEIFVVQEEKLVVPALALEAVYGTTLPIKTQITPDTSLKSKDSLKCPPIR